MATMILTGRPRDPHKDLMEGISAGDDFRPETPQEPHAAAAIRAASWKTAASISGVSLRVFVFCRLG